MTDVIRRGLRRYVAGAFIVALVLVGVGSTSQAAQPPSPTALFVATLRQIGAGTTIADQTDAYLINGGKSICTDIRNGATRVSMWKQVSAYYTPSAFQGVLQASVVTFCPEHLSVL